MLYDTHCHLSYFSDDILGGIIDRAKVVGLEYIVNAGVNVSEINREIDICNKYSDDQIKIFCGIANHPEHTFNNVVSVEELTKLATSSDKIKAIGETGLDTHIADNMDFIDNQIASFENHIETAINLKLPIIIHARGDFAVSKTIEILEYYKNQKVNLVLHSYTGSIENAKKALNIGCFISFNGIATFKNADDVRNIASIVPFDRMLIETDAPFLAPVPVRGEKNEVSFIKYTAYFLSDFLKIDYDEFCYLTTENAKSFFNNE